MTTCTGAGSCTTTTTTVTHGSDGTSKTGTDSKTEPKDSFCAKNPGDPQCKEKESSIGGSCAAVSCTGDAIQCAIAREQAKRGCEFFGDSPESTAGHGFAKEAQPAMGEARGEVHEVDIGGRFTSSAVNPFSSSCPGDVVTGSFVIPLSEGCGVLQMLGHLLVAFTVLSCAGWLVMKGI